MVSKFILQTVATVVSLTLTVCSILVVLCRIKLNLVNKFIFPYFTLLALSRAQNEEGGLLKSNTHSISAHKEVYAHILKLVFFNTHTLKIVNLTLICHDLPTLEDTSNFFIGHFVSCF